MLRSSLLLRFSEVAEHTLVVAVVGSLVEDLGSNHLVEDLDSSHLVGDLVGRTGC